MMKKLNDEIILNKIIDIIGALLNLMERKEKKEILDSDPVMKDKIRNNKKVFNSHEEIGKKIRNSYGRYSCSIQLHMV
jgi:hypothetical protein